MRSLLLISGLILSAGPVAAGVLAPGTVHDAGTAIGAGECDDGVVLDDGTLESGYGWVPSAVDGRYIQRFEVADFRSRKIDEVCVCWTRTRIDDDITFSVDLYRDRAGRPARDPEASVEATAELVPVFPDGAFVSVDVSHADMRADTNVFYLGVRWNPSVDDFFFVCVDQSDATPVVDGWFIDDRAGDWTSVLDTLDPIFDDHRAMMIRARAAEGYYAMVPALGPAGIVLLVAVICGAGWLVLRRGPHRR